MRRKPSSLDTRIIDAIFAPTRSQAWPCRVYTFALVGVCLVVMLMCSAALMGYRLVTGKPDCYP